MEKLQDPLHIGPEDLLLEHCNILGYDFEEMGEASAIKNNFWIAKMEATTSVIDRVHRRSEQTICSCYTTASGVFT